jgi:hypothetical protein
MRTLPFPEEAFAEVTHLWCLYRVDDPLVAIGEAERGAASWWALLLVNQSASVRLIVRFAAVHFKRITCSFDSALQLHE